MKVVALMLHIYNVNLVHLTSPINLLKSPKFTQFGVTDLLMVKC